jgi:hypothetical protein
MNAGVASMHALMHVVAVQCDVAHRSIKVVACFIAAYTRSDTAKETWVMKCAR